MRLWGQAERPARLEAEAGHRLEHGGQHAQEVDRAQRHAVALRGGSAEGIC